jgi:hypothetical protein
MIMYSRFDGNRCSNQKTIDNVLMVGKAGPTAESSVLNKKTVALT